MANKIYDNFVLANEIEDQYNSHLNLLRFCTVDNSLVGTPGMLKKIHTYSATDGFEKLDMGEGNSKVIETTYSEQEYRILLAQGQFHYFDEEAMTDPTAVQTGIRHLTTDLFNTINGDIFAEFNKATQNVTASAPNFEAFVDLGALLNVENLEGIEKFAFVNPKDMAKVRKALKDDLKYVEAFSRNGYVGTVAGWNLYTKVDATEGTIVGGTKDAVTMFNKKGTEVEQDRNPDIRKNMVIARKYYLAAITDYTKAVKLTISA